MNNITKQVITELETIKAIASELADMSPRTQMEIVALCKEICLNVDKVLEKHDIDLTTLFEYVQTIESELEEIRQLIDPQHLASIDERLEDLEASILTINESIGGINETLSTHTTQIQGLQNNKQDTLTAGENITIENNVISATGGDVHLYEHNLYIYTSSASILRHIEFTMTIINDNNTPYNDTTLREYLKNFPNGSKSCVGAMYDATYNIYLIIGLGCASDNRLKPRQRQAGDSYSVIGDFNATLYITDTIKQII